MHYGSTEIFNCLQVPSRDKLEAILAPPDTVGPSRPAEPPNPMVIGAVKTEANI